MNTTVPTATPGAGTRKTESTATADPATSSQVQRIDDFIRQKFAEANSADGSGVLQTAPRLRALGFGNSANSKYAEFLEAFRATPHLATHYVEEYPQCVFLPWAALRAVIKALDLWCDLPTFYTGGVPEDQITMMEIFELGPDDKMPVTEMMALVNEKWETERIRTLTSERERQMRTCLEQIQMRVRSTERPMAQETLEMLYMDMISTFLVLAPKEAFRSSMDLCERLRRIERKWNPVERQAPDDPLVIKMCRGGCLVVAAWGEEAAYLNKAIRDNRL